MAAALDTSAASQQAWLVKVPSLVAKAWRAQCDAPADKYAPLGMVVTTGGQTFVELPGGCVDGQPLPKRLKLESYEPATADDAKTHVISYRAHKTGGPERPPSLEEARVEGVIVKRMDLLPASLGPEGEYVVSEEYRVLAGQRMQASLAKRMVQSYNDSTREAIVENAQRTRALLAEQEVKRKAAATASLQASKDVRAAKLERAELEALLFRLFERQDVWHFNQLKLETKQPVMWLKQVLEGIAEQQRRGPNKDKYSLKREYRNPDIKMEDGEAA